MRILAIGAHPDDIEFACAGTLARCVHRGDAVSVMVVCRGDSASCGLPKAELAAVRSVELRNAAGLLGAEEVIELGYPDYGIWPGPESLSRFTEAIRQARPDVVITHHFADYGGDHNNTHLAALDATVAATVANYETASPPIAKVPFLFMMEPIGGYEFEPRVYVDVTETFATKVAMLRCHASQMEWMSRYGGFDSAKYVEVAARFRGYQAGVEMAEGFMPHSSFNHVPCGAVLP